MKPAFHWIRVTAFFGLLIMTTTMAASPVRETVLPLLSRQLARWTVTAPQPSALTLGAPDTGGGASGQRLDAARTPLGELTTPASYSATTAFLAEPDAREAATRAEATVWAADTVLAEANARAGASHFEVGPWQAASGSSAARSGSASLRRIRGEEASRLVNASAQGAAAGDAGPSTSSGSSASSGGSAGRAPSKPAPSTPPKGPANPSDVLNQHTQGLPTLLPDPAGAAATGLAVASLAGVASTPEPSSLLLLGTGLVATAGALRRRLRRER